MVSKAGNKLAMAPEIVRVGHLSKRSIASQAIASQRRRW
jgi:hypothetical protein